MKIGTSAYIGVRHRLFSSDPSRPICWYFCWYRENKRSRRLSLFRTKGIEQMARKNDGARTNPKQIRTDVDCRAARPKFDKGAWSPAKISDVTSGGLYLYVTPDKSRPGNAASKLWRMGYRFHSRKRPTPSAPTATARMARSRSQTRGASATKPKICSRKAKTRAPRSSSTSTGRRPHGLSRNGPTNGSRRRRWRKSNAAGSSRCAIPRPSRCSSCASATSANLFETPFLPRDELFNVCDIEFRQRTTGLS